MDYFTPKSVLMSVDLFPPLLVKYPSKIAPISEFFTAAKAGTLPGYCLVEPNYGSTSEEDPQNIASGEQFAASVVSAVMQGPGWKNTLLIWTYDEHGGYYDHVVAPKAVPSDSIAPKTNGGPAHTGFGQYGFRVPCAIVSPWARPNYVSHKVFDHASICALVEAKWNMPAMTHRDANANNMLDMLDLSKPAFLTPPKLSKPLVDVDPAALACDKSGPGRSRRRGSVSPPPHHP
jgi:phospholipase C